MLNTCDIDTFIRTRISSKIYFFVGSRKTQKSYNITNIKVERRLGLPFQQIFAYIDNPQQSVWTKKNEIQQHLARQKNLDIFFCVIINHHGLKFISRKGHENKALSPCDVTILLIFLFFENSMSYVALQTIRALVYTVFVPNIDFRLTYGQSNLY